MGNFFAELKRRHIYRVAAAYVVVAWLALQVVNNVAPVLDLPPWVARAILLLLVIGFPFSLLLAWIVEGPERSRRKSRPAQAAAADSRVDWILAGALAGAIAIVAYQQIAPVSAPPPAQQSGLVAAQQAAATPSTAISVVVLPFENLSAMRRRNTSLMA